MSISEEAGDMARVNLLGIACATALTVACGGNRDEARNETATVTQSEERAEATGADDVRGFVERAAIAGMAEVQLGQMAIERATNPEVKQFAQMMVKEHTAAGQELESAVAGQIALPTALDEKHRDLAERLGQLSGAEFDREYMKAMVDGHQDVRDLLDNRADEPGATGTAGTTGTDEKPTELAVNGWAARTLPTVRQHLQMAEQIAERVDR